ncbi:hypothetical protein [Streptomyces sp. NPDC021212]|uniref:hypothetical protein n=1 Tax=Streptomyces sp. NPDC021212 TaxID=3365118 RepID=UPI00378C7155
MKQKGLENMEPWEMRDAVEDGVRAAHGLPRSDRGEAGCLKFFAIGCGGFVLLGFVAIWVYFFLNFPFGGKG